MRKGWVALLFLWTASCFAEQIIPGEVSATPDVYKVTIRRVLFFDTETSTWKTYIDESFVMDIASVNPGAAVGEAGRGNEMPTGTFSKLRFLIWDTFTLKGSVADAGNGTGAYTNSDQTGTIELVNFGEVKLASNGTGSPTEQSVIIPTGQSVDEAIQNDTGMITETIDGLRYFAGDMDLGTTFTISEDTKELPKIQLNFDVTNTLKFYDPGNLPPQIAVYASGPQVSISVSK